MATAVKEKTKPAAVAAAGPYKVKAEGPVALAGIRVESNYRKNFNAKAMEELAESVKKVGVLQPILLRHDGKDLVLVAGERRLRAAKMAGLKTIPARVLDVTPEQAAEIQALENLHREDLGPIEEARAFKTLLDQGKYTVEALAERVDKSKAYVYRAVRLTELPKKIQEKIESGEWSAAAGHELLRVPKEQMDRAIQVTSRCSTVGQMREEIDRYLGRTINGAAFPTKTPYAGKPACEGCAFNSSNENLLFDDLEKGMCANAECFDHKQNAWGTEASKEKAAKLGLKDLGVRKKDYSDRIEGLKNARVVVISDVEKLFKEHPDKFAVSTVRDKYGDGKPKVRVVCLDERVLPSQRYQASPQEKSRRKAELAKRRHESDVKETMYREIFNKMPGRIEHETVLPLVKELDKSYWDREIWAAVGIEKKGQSSVEESELSKLSAQALFKVAFLLAVGGFRDGWTNKPTKEYAELGFDLVKLRARAEKEVRALSKSKPAAKAKA